MEKIEGLGDKRLFDRDSRWHTPAPDVHVLENFSNACAFVTGEGVVLFDVGFIFSGQRILDGLRKVTDQPVRYIIYGHGHADHAFGTPAILAEARERGFPRPVIVAHRNLPRRFDRYRRMLAYHGHINRIQFDIPENVPGFVETYVYPDLTYDSSMQFSLGGVNFQLHHTLGETDDHTWLWVPEKRTAAVSDVWVWSCPNIGNPFKVQRYELEWAAALEAIAGKEPELLLPGHGPVIAGQARVQEACTTVARALRFLHDQVVDLLNQGKWPEQILHEFEWPEEFQNSPYLRPIYGHPYFVVMGILRRYHGWYDGNAANLFPERSEEVAAELVALVKDSKTIRDRARELQSQGRLQMALHLADLVVKGAGAETEKAQGLELKAELLEARAAREPSLIARNIFLAGARRARKDRNRMSG